MHFAVIFDLEVDFMRGGIILAVLPTIVPFKSQQHIRIHINKDIFFISTIHTHTHKNFKTTSAIILHDHAQTYIYKHGNNILLSEVPLPTYTNIHIPLPTYLPLYSIHLHVFFLE